MVKLIWPLLICAFSTQSFGQNLIPNPGFEDCAKCDSRGFKELGIGSGANDPADWNAATYGTPDFQSIAPYNGKEHGGFFLGFPKYEYLTNHFTECLKAGAKYQFSFMIRPDLRNLKYIIDEIGVYIQKGPAEYFQSEPLKQIIPTFQSNDGDFISHTGYRKFSFEYLAQGGEDHFIVGRFRALGLGDTTFISGGGLPPANPASEPIYYFVDDFEMIEISPPQIDLIPDIISITCQGQNNLISIPPPYNKGNIEWSTGQTTETIEISNPGKVFVTIKLNDSCHTTLLDSTQVVILNVESTLEISGPDGICYGKSVELIAECDSCLSFTWNTNETSKIIKVSNPGIYSLIAITKCDTLFQTKELKSQNVILDSLLKFPNVFFPNGEPDNRTFNPLINELKRDSIISLKLYIYNRWGQKLDEINDINAKWIPDTNVPMDTYMYICELEYKDCDGPKKGTLKGTVTLLR